VLFFDQREAMSQNRLVQTALWRMASRRPVYLNSFSKSCEKTCTEHQPSALIATGAAPLTVRTLRALKQIGVQTINYSTDDPWNALAIWHLKALPEYNTVFTPRRTNIQDLLALGCTDVRYLPFGYDEDLFFPPNPQGSKDIHDVLFVGGADEDRAGFFVEFAKCGIKPTLIGSYWNRYVGTRHFTLGHQPPELLRDLTASAGVNICLVRHANRDGHVMRSFEIPAVGGFMIAEDTAEHRDFFGEEGKCVLYFKTPEEAAKKTAWAIANKSERQRMAKAAHDRVVMGPNTYKDRLKVILGWQ
jgi:spore maturation protein CgeB